jgi:hypothetical protein
VTAVFVLDVPENQGLVDVAERDPMLVVDKVGPYFRIVADGGPTAEPTTEPLGPGHTSRAGEIVIDRRAAGCRHAVWYSAVAGLQGARIVQHDKNALRLVSRQDTR